MSPIEWFKEAGFNGLIDIGIMAFLIYAVLVWFKKTRAASVLTGLMIIAGFYLLTRQFNLTMTAQVFEQFFAVILIAFVVIFQEELRHAFERVAVLSTSRRTLKRRMAPPPFQETIESLVRAATYLARHRVGALIVLKGRDMIVRHLDGGITLNGQISEPLLLSIFDSHSPGHDGAVVIENYRIHQYAAHLPLSKNVHKIGAGGTRHAAALGLAELTDAMSLVVSEERGTISVAHDGHLRKLDDAAELTGILERFFRTISPKKEARPWADYVRRNYREKIIAAGLALALWFVLVQGSKIAYKTFSIPISYAQLPKPKVIETIEPEEINVTFRGPRHSFYFLRKSDIRLQLDLDLERKFQKLRIYPNNLAFPKNLILESWNPDYVEVRITTLEEKEKKDEKT